MIFEKIGMKVRRYKIQIPVDNKIGGRKIIDRENAIVNLYND